MSKLLSWVLRHRPDAMGVELDAAGWVEVDVLLAALRARGHEVTREELERVVATSDKRRFGLSEDGLRIRAHQGHSVEVELDYEPCVPPARLFHGTVARSLESIRRRGLERGKRHHVHLSVDVATARTVGGRRGRPVILEIDAAAMHADGHVFLVTPNGVWLTEHVPPEYLRELSPAEAASR